MTTLVLGLIQYPRASRLTSFLLAVWTLESSLISPFLLTFTNLDPQKNI